MQIFTDVEWKKEKKERKKKEKTLDAIADSIQMWSFWERVRPLATLKNSW